MNLNLKENNTHTNPHIICWYYSYYYL